MVTYSNPVAKSWTLNNYAGYSKGDKKGVEIENPGFADKIVLECALGENLLQNTERDWNPSLETENPLQPGTPYRWWLWGAGSEYIQNDPEGAYDGQAYARLRDTQAAGEYGHLHLAPEINTDTFSLPVTPSKSYTIRYHGRYVNAEQRTPMAPYAWLVYNDDGVDHTEYPIPLFAGADVLPPNWVRTDYRLGPDAGVTNRTLRILRLFFGSSVGNAFPGQHWDIDTVEIAETFPANPTYFARGTYESPVLYTPPGLSKVTWGTFAADTTKPANTAVDFSIRGYDVSRREWSPWFAVTPGDSVTAVISPYDEITDVTQWTRVQWQAVLRWTGTTAPTDTPVVNSVTVNYDEQFRTDHPRVGVEVEDLAAINTRIGQYTPTAQEYQQVLTLAQPALTETPPPFAAPGEAYNRHLMVINCASVIYLLGREANGDAYAEGAAAWAANLLACAPFFLEAPPPRQLNAAFYDGGYVALSGTQGFLCTTLARFRDFCHVYLDAHLETWGALKTLVETTLLQMAYWALSYLGEDAVYSAWSAFNGLYLNMIKAPAALWDNEDVYDATYPVLAKYPFIPPRDLMERAERFHVEKHVAYLEEHFPDGAPYDAGGYGHHYYEFAMDLFKVWKAALRENWFLKAAFLRGMCLYHIHDLNPDVSHEKLTVGDATIGLYCDESIFPAAAASEYDAPGDIGPVLRYMTESLYGFFPANADIWYRVIPRLFYRNPGGVQTSPADAGIPATVIYPSRGDVFMRTAWEFDPPDPALGYYYGLRYGTNTHAILVAFTSGPALTCHNHTCQNAFTIFARGHLALDSGIADGCPSSHRKNYFERTIAHNAILIFDPIENYPHDSGTYTPSTPSNDGGQVDYNLEDSPPDFNGTQNFGDFFKYHRTRDAGLVERFDARAEYDYVFGRARVAYNAYNYLDKPYYEKCAVANRELVLVKPFPPFIPEPPPGGDVYPYFIVVFDEVAPTLKTYDPSVKTKWVIHGNEKPEFKTASGWVSSPGAGTPGWTPTEETSIFRMASFTRDPEAEYNYKGRLFGITLLPAPANGRSSR